MGVWGVDLVVCVCFGVGGVILCRCVCVWPVDLYTNQQPSHPTKPAPSTGGATRGDSSALRSAFVVRVVCYEGFTKAWGAGEVLSRCAQLLWCELYVVKDLQKEKKRAHILRMRR